MRTPRFWGRPWGRLLDGGCPAIWNKSAAADVGGSKANSLSPGGHFQDRIPDAAASGGASMSDPCTALDSRLRAPEYPFAAVICDKAPAPSGEEPRASDSSSFLVRSLPEGQVLWSRGEVLALRRLGGRRAQ
jgi:hypothetical protein